MPRSRRCCCGTTIEDCGDLAACLAGKSLIITVGLSDDECDECERAAGTYNICFDGVGCYINSIFRVGGFPIAETYICDKGWILSFGIGLGGLFVEFSLTLSDSKIWSTVGESALESLNALCAGEVVTLPVFSALGDACTAGTTTMQLVPTGSIECGRHVPVLDPPDPPPNDPPDCAGLEECEEMPDLIMSLGEFDNYTEVTTDVGVPWGDLYTEWFPEVLTGAWYMPYVPSSSYEFYLPLVPLSGGSPITGDYSEPGELLRRRTPVDTGTYPNAYREDYVYGLRVVIDCTDGVVKILYVQWDTQTFTRESGSGPTDPPNFTGTETITAGAATGDRGSPAYPCRTDEMTTGFLYTNVMSSAPTGDKVYYVIGRIGGGA